MESSQPVNNQLRPELSKEEKLRARAINIASQQVFQDVNSCARGILVGIADVNDVDLGLDIAEKWQFERDQIYTAMSLSVERLMKTNFVKE